MLDPERPLMVYELHCRDSRKLAPEDEATLPGPPSPEEYLGAWPEGDYSYLFFTVPAEGIVQEFLEAHPEYELSGRYSLLYGQWQQLEPSNCLEIDRFRIVAGPGHARADDGGILLRIDPGVIFGSGLHPTTRGCLRALSRVFEEETPGRVLDLGTGTGILAVASALLGASRVEAWDLNPMAVGTARSNCERNAVADRVTVRRADARRPLPHADLLCANIHLDYLLDFLPGGGSRRYRWSVLGGFLRERLEEVLRLLPPDASPPRHAIEEEGWMTLVLRAA